MKFEEKLMKLRKQNAWSQEDLARKLDVTRQTISKWELGQTAPDIDNLTKIAQLFGTTVNDLLDEKIATDTNNENSNKNNSIKIIILIIVLIVALLGIATIIFEPVKKIFEQSFNITNQIFNKTEEAIDPAFNETEETVRNIVTDTKNSMEIKEFNNAFENLYYGSTDGFFMNNFIDEIIKSNQKNPNNIITLQYNDIQTNNPDEIRKLKDQFKVNTKYEILYEYDNYGFINKAIVKQ